MDVSRLALYAASGLAAVYVSFGVMRTLAKKRRLQKAIRKRKQQRNETIYHLRSSLEIADESVTERRQWIVSLSLTELINELQSDKILPTEVLEAYQWGAIKSNDVTNCVCQFIAEAHSWAAEMEQKYRSKTNKPPLYGVPISVKESIQIEGYDSTRGYAQDIGRPSKKDSDAVKLLRHFGAIPFVQTNVPQSLLSFNCSNPVYGRTSNPVYPTRTCGGSTGGEAALIATGGSILGVGGDVGGSIRIPANFCGITGFKPSHIRISQRGSKGSVPGRPMLCASLGPMARNVDGLATFMKVLLCDDMYTQNPYVVPLPFNEEVYQSRKKILTIGYYDYDGFTPAAPACRRAVSEAVQVLERAGHKLVRFDPPDVNKAFRMVLGAATVDNGRYLLNLMKNDIIDPNYAFKVKLYSIPVFVKRLLRPLVSFVSPDFGDLIKALTLDTSDLREIYENIGKYREQFVDCWREMNLDAVVCPPTACTALSHGYPDKITGAVSYCSLFNLLDFPAGVVPVTRVNKNDEAQMKTDYKPVSFSTKLIKKDCSANTVGLSVGVQCAALPFREEICLRVMKEIEDGLKKD